MYDIILKKLAERESPIDVIVTGLGFMGFGFLSSVVQTPGIRVPLIITRRPTESKKFLEQHGFSAICESDPQKIAEFASRGFICVSSDLDLIKDYPSDAVLEVTGTVAYGTQVALRTISAKKHLITMNPELQATLGSQLKLLADKAGVVITDVTGDQPGSLARLIGQSKLMGFKVLLAGNMKRYLNHHATQEEMQPWATDKGLSVRQTVSFTDGTKQSIEMTLVANYFGMDITQFGMRGPEVEEVQDVLKIFPWHKLPANGIVDYVIGRKLFPGIFVVAEHQDKNQQKYLRYLGLGEGPRYVLFEPYHLCHLEVAGTIAQVVIFGQPTINNSTAPLTTTIAVAKTELKKGDVLDGIGGDTIYGKIDKITLSGDYLPMGLAEGATINNSLHQDQPIKLSDVTLPVNAATILAGLVKDPQSQ
jgi:predicted homoserine dehydrogenase-like protein